MKFKGKIDRRIYEWADMLRLAGNEAAHDTHVDVPREDAIDVLGFANAIIDYVFSFKDKFDEFKHRRESC